MLIPLALVGALVAVNCKSTTAPVTDTSGDVTLAAPPAGEGFQIVLGPFDVPAGQEVQNNFYMKLPVDTDVYITKVEFKFNPGSHHCTIFKSDTADIPNDPGQPYHLESNFNALQWDSWDMVCASQVDSFTWTLPPGVAIHLKGRQQLDIQSHYVNASTQQTANGHGKVIVNFWTTPKSNVTSLVGAVFSNNKKIDLMPHTGATYLKVVNAWPAAANLILMTGHFHSRGKSFVVGHWDSPNHRLRDTIYSNQTWDEPPVTPVVPTLAVSPGDSLAYVCSYENRTDNEIKFGGHVETEEHANLFLFYYPGPADSKAIYDFSGGELVEEHPLP